MVKFVCWTIVYQIGKKTNNYFNGCALISIVVSILQLPLLLEIIYHLIRFVVGIDHNDRSKDEKSEIAHRM